jgi:hypothetical protein
MPSRRRSCTRLRILDGSLRGCEPVPLAYRLWSIEDRHPAMLRATTGGAAIAVEVWYVPAAGLTSILIAEPAGLTIGKIELADGSEVLGVLGEPWLCEGQGEITASGGWRAYIASRPAHL